MLLNTQITMPNLDPMAEQEFSLASRKVRKWVKALPCIEQNIAAQQFYDGLKRSNRQAHATKQRLAAINIMRPVARKFLEQQYEYLIAQLFPLSKKASEILRLQQNILSELAVAYKIIIQETANRDTQLSQNKLIVCIHHAMHYILEQYVSLAQVYSEPPQGYWQDYCQLYKMAEHLSLSHMPIKNETKIISSKFSTNCLFKQACLLSLANLHTFGHGEAEEIAFYLESMNHLAKLSDEKPSHSGGEVYFINLSLNKPPRLAAADGIPVSSKNRFLNPENLINELREIETRAISSNSTLSKSLAKRLLNKLTSKPKRAAKRTASPKGKLTVAIGLRDAINILLYPNYDLDTDKNEIEEEKNKDKIKINPIVQSWEISNASNGGYCLQSKNTSDYQSQVGDLVLLRSEDDLNDSWHLGVVRWMQSLSDQGVKIGIEALNGSVQPVKVIDAHFSSHKLKGLEHILQLTEETADGKLLTLIAPPNSINMGETLNIQVEGSNETVEFQQPIERTISFVRFSFLIQPGVS